MSKYTELAMERRSHFSPDGRPVYNCAQAVVCAFAEETGLDEETCRRMATYFRGGMQMGSVCGAITGGMMALGLMGVEDAGVLNGYYRKLKAAHDGMLECKDLLRANAERGGEKMPHCNAMIRECVDYVEQILREQAKL